MQSMHTLLRWQFSTHTITILQGTNKNQHIKAYEPYADVPVLFYFITIEQWCESIAFTL